MTIFEEQGLQTIFWLATTIEEQADFHVVHRNAFIKRPYVYFVAHRGGGVYACLDSTRLASLFQTVVHLPEVLKERFKQGQSMCHCSRNIR